MGSVAALDPDAFVVVLVLALLVVCVLVIWLMGRGLSSWRDGLSGVDEGLLAREGRAPERADDEELHEEVRELVVADNERRKRRGKPPLDVEQEVERRLRELGVWS